MSAVSQLYDSLTGLRSYVCQAQFMHDRGVRVEDMSLTDLVGQTMVVPLYGSSATTVTTEQAAANRSIYGEALPSEIIERFRPGGVLLIDRIAFHPGFEHLPLGNASTASQLVEYTAGLQEAARSAGMPGLLIVADQEGGRVNQLPVPALPAAAVVGATGRPDLARRAGELTGRIARSLGVNVLFYPVADVGIPRSVIEHSGPMWTWLPKWSRRRLKASRRPKLERPSNTGQGMAAPTQTVISLSRN